MNNKDIEKLFMKENSQINIKQSEALKSTPIISNTVSKQRNTQKHFSRWRLLPIGLCSLVLIFVAIFAILPMFKSGDMLGQYTSYVLEINPQICITTNNDDNVVSIVSLNDDGDLVLSDEFFDNIDENTKLNDCLDRIIAFIYDENPDKFALENGIKLYATNDVESIARDKLSKTKYHISSKLNELGKPEIPVEDHFMPHKDFGDRMGFDDFNGLDKMIDDIKGKDRFFDPDKNPPPPPPSDDPNVPDGPDKPDNIDEPIPQNEEGSLDNPNKHEKNNENDNPPGSNNNEEPQNDDGVPENNNPPPNEMP
ncbi:MAG: hypothetical protein IJW59_01175 [Clostridia bacterium]|nr:hypothetical protein [Clostridia bacterium]